MKTVQKGIVIFLACFFMSSVFAATENASTDAALDNQPTAIHSDEHPAIAAQKPAAMPAKHKCYKHCHKHCVKNCKKHGKLHKEKKRVSKEPK